MFAPGYQHKFSVYEDSGAQQVHQGIIDLYFVKTFNNKQQWLLVDPQIVSDFENNTEVMSLDIEVGTMLDNILGTQGYSLWARPSLGAGPDRPYDFSHEGGYKIVW